MALSIKHQETSMPMKERYLTLQPSFLYHDAHCVQLVVNHWLFQDQGCSCSPGAQTCSQEIGPHFPGSNCDAESNSQGWWTGGSKNTWSKFPLWSPTTWLSDYWNRKWPSSKRLYACCPWILVIHVTWSQSIFLINMQSVLAPNNMSTASNSKDQVPIEFKVKSPLKSNHITKKRGLSTEKEEDKNEKQDVEMKEQGAPIVLTGAYMSYMMEVAGLLMSSQLRRCHSCWHSVWPWFITWS